MGDLEFLHQLKTPIGLVGYGLSNQEVELYLAEHNLNSCVFTDASGDGEHFCTHSQAEMLVVSPGYPLSREWIRKARGSGVRMSSELSLASEVVRKHNNQELWIGVTGSVGKSTLVSLLTDALEAEGLSVFLGGNIGNPLMKYARQLEAGESPVDVIVLELSSYQLENCGDLELNHSILCYLSPNHLERYESVEDYFSQKVELFKRTKHFRLANADSPQLSDFFQKSTIEEEFEFYKVEEPRPFDLEVLNKKAMVGAFNNQHLVAAAKMLEHLKLWNETTKQALLGFKGLPHRLERMDSVPGRPVCINDSKGTSLESVRSAVESVLPEFERQASEKGSLYLLLGGQDKGLPWGQLSDLAELPWLQFLFFGEMGPSVQAKSGLAGPVYPTLMELCNQLPQHVDENDWLLFCPGGTSWDEFKNFEERGHFFKKRVEEIWK